MAHIAQVMLHQSSIRPITMKRFSSVRFRFEDLKCVTAIHIRPASATSRYVHLLAVTKPLLIRMS